jgi:tryptophan-rich sensory protein
MDTALGLCFLLWYLIVLLKVIRERGQNDSWLFIPFTAWMIATYLPILAAGEGLVAFYSFIKRKLTE